MIELREWMTARDVERILLVGPSRLWSEVYGVQVARDLQDPNVRYVAISRTALDGVPIITSHGFAFVRPWRTLRTQTPAVDLGGIVIYDIDTIHRHANGQPWIAVFEEWQDAVNDPMLAPIEGLRERLKLP
jgi:hypothetical protein